MEICLDLHVTMAIPPNRSKVVPDLSVSHSDSDINRSLSSERGRMSHTKGPGCLEQMDYCQSPQRPPEMTYMTVPETKREFGVIISPWGSFAGRISMVVAMLAAASQIVASAKYLPGQILYTSGSSNWIPLVGEMRTNLRPKPKTNFFGSCRSDTPPFGVRKRSGLNTSGSG